MFWVSWRCVNKITEGNSSVFSVIPNALDAISKDMLLLLKSVEFDDDAALLLSVAGLVMGPHVTSESEILGTDSAAIRTSYHRMDLSSALWKLYDGLHVVLQPFKKLLRPVSQTVLHISHI